MVRRLPTRARIAALEAGLLAGTAAERRVIAAAIAGLPTHSMPEAARVLVLQWGRERDAEIRAAILDHIRGFDRGVLETELRAMVLGGSGDELSRNAAMGIIGAVPVSSLCDRLVNLLADAAAGEAAESAFVSMTSWLIEGKASGRLIAVGAVGSALFQAAERFREHRRMGILVCLFRLAQARFRLPGIDDASAPAAWLSDSDHPAGTALRRLIRTSGDPAISAAAWSWLRVPTLSGACVDHVAKLENDGLAALLARVALLQNPARRAALRRVVAQRGGTDSIPLDASAVDGHGAPIRAAFAAWAAAAPAPAAVRDASMAPLLTDREPAVRLSVLRGAWSIAPLSPCALDLCFDEDPRVAHAAAIKAVCDAPRQFDPARQARNSPQPLIESLARSQHPRVARLVRSAMMPAWAEIDHPALRARLASERQREPDALIARIRGCVRSGEQDAPAAIAVARRLRLVPMIVDALLDSVSLGLHAGAIETAQRLACCALAACGDLTDTRSAEALRAALRCELPRARANAAEALHRRARRAAPIGVELDHELRTMCHDSEHRPRASAARVLLSRAAPQHPRMANLRDAGERTLLAMLEDPRPMHRVAGLWLAERAATRAAPLPEVVDAVASLARVAQGHERARARQAAERLIIEVRAGWSARARSMGSGSEAQEAVA